MGSLTPRTSNRFPNAGESYTGSSRFLNGPRGEELRDALGRLYAVFAVCRLSSPLRGCPHCFTDSDLNYLQTTALQSLTHGDLALIASKLVTTLGEPDDIAYFLPRIMEALAEGAYIELEPLADRLAQIPASHWNLQREQALRDCFTLLFAMADGTVHDLGDESRQSYIRTTLPRVFST